MSVRASERQSEKDGGWFCKFCQRFTSLNQDRELNVCARCGRPGMKFHPPAQQTSRERVHEEFEKIRKLVEEA